MGCRARTAAGRTTPCLCRRIIQVTHTASSPPANPTSRAEKGTSCAGSSQAPSGEGEGSDHPRWLLTALEPPPHPVRGAMFFHLGNSEDSPFSDWPQPDMEFEFRFA